MPIIWRYLFTNYFKLFFLTIFTFVTILLVIRFQEIARFAALTPYPETIAIFILLQIPYILPLAIPISALLSTTILLTRMDQSRELVVLRCFSLSKTAILYPIFLISFLIGLGNFIVTSEIAPYSRQQGRRLIHHIMQLNPLFLLQKETLIKFKDAFFDVEEMENGKYANNVLFVGKNHAENRLALLYAKNLTVESDALVGNEISTLSHIDSMQSENFDHLIMDHQKKIIMDPALLSDLLHPYQELKHVKLFSLRELLYSPFARGQIDSEVARRFSLALAVVTFNLIAIAACLQRRIYISFIISALFMGCYGSAFSMNDSHKAILFYLLPHLFMLLLGCVMLNPRFTRQAR